MVGYVFRNYRWHFWKFLRTNSGANKQLVDVIWVPVKYSDAVMLYGPINAEVKNFFDVYIDKATSMFWIGFILDSEGLGKWH